MGQRRGFALCALLLIFALAFGGLSHSFVEHDHGSVAQADLLHAALHSEYWKMLLLILISAFFSFELFARFLPVPVFVRWREEEKKLRDPFQKAILKGGICSVYE